MTPTFTIPRLYMPYSTVISILLVHSERLKHCTMPTLSFLDRLKSVIQIRLQRCRMQRVNYMASEHALCYFIFVGMCHVTVKTIFCIFLLYVIRVCQSLKSMQTDDETGHLSAEYADRDGIFKSTTCLEKEKNRLI